MGRWDSWLVAGQVINLLLTEFHLGPYAVCIPVQQLHRQCPHPDFLTGQTENVCGDAVLCIQHYYLLQTRLQAHGSRTKHLWDSHPLGSPGWQCNSSTVITIIGIPQVAVFSPLLFFLFWHDSNVQYQLHCQVCWWYNHSGHHQWKAMSLRRSAWSRQPLSKTQQDDCGLHEATGMGKIWTRPGCSSFQSRHLPPTTSPSILRMPVSVAWMARNLGVTLDDQLSFAAKINDTLLLQIHAP